MKMRIRVTLHHEDESEVTEATTMEVEVPDFEAFAGPDTFGEVFDQYEQTVIEARNGVMKAATEKYLVEMAKKNSVRDRGTRRKNH
jgi:ribosomal protein S8